MLWISMLACITKPWYSSPMSNKKPKETVNIRVYKKTWKRAKIDAIKRGMNLMDYLDIALPY